MRTAVKVTVLGGADIYRNYVRSLHPALWYRLNETSGTAAINYGSLGATYNGTYTACTLAQAGQIGPASAVLFDGTTSLITVTLNAGYADVAAYTVAMLVKPSSAGEASSGTFYRFGNSTNRLRFSGSVNVLDGAEIGGTNATATTTAGIPTTSWSWVFRTYENVTERKIHVLKGASGAVTEYSYSAQAAMTGTKTDKSGNLIIGNEVLASATFAGLYDEFLWFNGILTTAQMLQITKLSHT